MTGAEFWEALRKDGPLLEDDDEFFKALEELASIRPRGGVLDFV